MANWRYWLPRAAFALTLLALVVISVGCSRDTGIPSYWLAP